MKRSEIRALLDADIATLEKMEQTLLSSSESFNELDLDSLASVEFLEDLKARSEAFDKWLPDPVFTQGAITDYLDRYERETHIALDGSLFWTPHAIEHLTKTLGGCNGNKTI